MKVVDKGLKEKIWTRRERYKNMNLVANLTHLRKEAKGTKTDSKRETIQSAPPHVRDW